jgi:hypothetical protein
MLRLDAVPEPVVELLGQLGCHKALEQFALGGGTSLALRFGHRLSVDLDYFTTSEFQPQELFETLGLEAATILSVSKNTLSLDAGGVKMDLLRHGYAEIAPVDRIGGHRLVSLPDLTAMKLNAIANRGSKKDFYDVVELLQHYSLTAMLGFFSKKYPNTDPFAVVRSLAWFEEADQEPDPIPMLGQTWESVKRIITGAVGEL